MALCSAEHQLVIFDYVVSKIHETVAVFNEANTDPNKIEEFNVMFEELAEKRNDFQSNYFSLCANPPNPEIRSLDDIKTSFAECERLLRQLRIGYNRCQSKIEENSSSEKLTRSTLPPLPLPVFSGNRVDWTPFSELFSSIVHNDKSLSRVQKLHYLIGCLTSEPKELVSNIPLTEENYEVVWSLLEKKYKSVRVTATMHVQNILHIPSVNSNQPETISRFVSTVQENINALKAENFPVSEWSFLLLNIILEKLDVSLRQAFEITVEQDVPTCEQLMLFLERQAIAGENVQLIHTRGITGLKQNVNRTNSKVSSTASFKANYKHGTNKANTLVALQNQLLCKLCRGNHNLDKCPEFLLKNVQDRIAFVQEQCLCFNCLRANHTAQRCLSKFSCKQCHKKHHSTLHRENKKGEPPQTEKATEIEGMLQTMHSSTKMDIRPTTVLLQTALVYVKDGSDNYQVVRALLDGASQTSFITENCVQRLGLRRHQESMNVFGVGQTSVLGSRGVTTCCVKSMHCDGAMYDTKATILKTITHPLPSLNLDISKLTHLRGLKLADPRFHIPGQIDMLISADIVSDAMTGTKIPGSPSAFHSQFGWIVTGAVKCYSDQTPQVSCLVRTVNLESELQKFWEIEEVPKIMSLSPEDSKCEDLFKETHSRTADGRYSLHLPFIDDQPALGDSLQHAFVRYNHLEKKLARYPELAVAYQAFMQEYEDLGHMTKVCSIQQSQNRPAIQDVQVQPAYVIPHHAVIKDTSSTTKVRVVFDGSAKTSNGSSLNDCLLTGPKLQKDIVEIVFNFRTNPVVFTADICKMYRQILIVPEDRKYQCILWRARGDQEIQLYQLNTVTYGLASSPYHALRTLQQLALDEGSRFPRAATVLARDIFVDDIVSGSATLEEALQVKSELVSLLASAGFELRKWASNHPEFLDGIPIDQCETMRSFDDASSGIRVLGLHWCPNEDEFTYHVSIPVSPITKRGILSTVARLFDPCGWVSPVIVWVKILLQTLWTLGLDWDAPVPERVSEQWLTFTSSLDSLSNVKIPRLVFLSSAFIIQYHGFCDASEKAFAATVYIRLVNSHGVVSTQLLIAKSKVAPLKVLSIPRLELSGALLLAELWQCVVNIWGVHPGKSVFMWCDSTTVLSWVKSSPHKFKTFVANRVSRIQSLVPPSSWGYVPSSSNPADLASRGLFPHEIVNCSLWFNGPDWLQKAEDQWPVCPKTTPVHNLDECKGDATTVFVVIEPPPEIFALLEGFSSLRKLKRVTAWVLRAKDAFKQTQCYTSNVLSTNELCRAMCFWIQHIQNKHFVELISCLMKGESPKEFKHLQPFLDCHGIVRVGGRLQNSTLPESTKHPVLLPRKCHLSRLIVQHYHTTYLHAGPQTTQSLIQRQYWILNARGLVRKELHHCLKCFRLKAKPVTPLMGNLPASRFSQVRAFLKVGTDFAGPFLCKQSRARKAVVTKAYLCIFVCMSTKAVHCELVSSLCVQAFLAALKRFVSLRGTPIDIYSDQGSNFKGAFRHLKEVYDCLFSEPAWQALQPQLINLNLQWHFNPPAAPQFGGLWEAAVKSTKHHLKRVIGEQTLTFEELATLFTEISAVLNSRPLCPLSADPSELDILTPGHFLVGAPLVGLPEDDLSHLKLNKLDRWQLITKLRQSLWKRWSIEYLHTLQQCYKCNTHTTNLKIGTLVLIKDNNLPTFRWRTGRITETHPGPDGIVRVVTLRTLNGDVKRPVSKLCPLPL